MIIQTPVVLQMIFGFNFYLESFGENLELDKLKKLVLFEDIDQPYYIFEYFILT